MRACGWYRSIGLSGTMLGCTLLCLPAIPQENHNERIVDAALDSVAGLPPGLQAYFLFRLASRSRSAESKQKILVEAHRQALLAEPPYRTRYVGPIGMSISVLNGEVAAPRIDRLGLELQILNELATVNVALAREYLEQVELAVPQQSEGCRQTRAPDLRPDYVQLRGLLDRLFTRSPEDQIARGRTIARTLHQLRSSSQLAGAVELIRDDGTPGADLALQVSILVAAMNTLDDGDPLFGVAMFNDGLPLAIHALVRLLSDQRISPASLLRAYREYIRRNTGLRCTYLVQRDRRLMKLAVVNYILRFNDLVTRLTARGVISPGEVDKFSEPPQTMVRAVDETGTAIREVPQSKQIQAAFVALEQHTGTREEWAGKVDHLIEAAGRRGAEAMQNVDAANASEVNAEVGHLWRMLLRTTNIPAHQERVAREYAGMIGDLWQYGQDNPQYYAELRELLVRCWGSARTPEEGKSLREARLSGIRAGLMGKPALLAKLVGLVDELEEPEITCAPE
ncbi:MAG TPA: hypothetical protein VG672_08910 [Bryobacteraceae bacterium]|nr:hypothetical protein [Bryobacteraceae bacterium]